MKTITHQLIFTILGLIFIKEQALASDCTPAPDCDILGYTQNASNCKEGKTLKCPFNSNQVICVGTSDSSSAGNPNTPSVVPNLGIGSILYGDGSISKELISAQTPIGIIFDPINRLAFALTDVKKDGSSGNTGMYWASKDCNIPNLELCTDKNTVTSTCGTDGQKNTNTISSSSCSSTSIAVNAVKTYEPQGCTKDFCKKGKWFLPSLKEMYSIFGFKEIMNSVLKSITSQETGQIKSSYSYWTSTPYTSDEIWTLGIFTGNNYEESHIFNNNKVRPVIKF